jgi:hypothetical protein
VFRSVVSQRGRSARTDDESLTTAAQFAGYGVLCARQLARAHSQSPEGELVRRYLGGSGVFDAAVARWARAYADVCEADHAALAAAAKAGRLPAEHGV